MRNVLNRGLVVNVTCAAMVVIALFFGLIAMLPTEEVATYDAYTVKESVAYVDYEIVDGKLVVIGDVE